MNTRQNRILSRYRTHFGFLILALTLMVWAVVGNRYVPSAKAAQTTDKYIGSQACAPCHASIYTAFGKTSMGRSMAAITPAEMTPALLDAMHLPATYDDTKLNRHFSIYAQDGKLYQSEFQTDAAGKETNGKSISSWQSSSIGTGDMSQYTSSAAGMSFAHWQIQASSSALAAATKMWLVVKYSMSPSQ